MQITNIEMIRSNVRKREQSFRILPMLLGKLILIEHPGKRVSQPFLKSQSQAPSIIPPPPCSSNKISAAEYPHCS